MNTLDAAATDRRTFDIAAKVVTEVAATNPGMSIGMALKILGCLFFAQKDAQAELAVVPAPTAVPVPVLAAPRGAPVLLAKAAPRKRVRKSRAKFRDTVPVAVSDTVAAPRKRVRKSRAKVREAVAAPVAVAAVPNAAPAKPFLPLRTDGVPAVPVNQSLHDDYVVCLEDGTKHIMMKRHLRRYGLTPEQYLARWNLPEGYPLVAPSYSLRKLEEARRNRLGSKENKSGMTAAQIDALEATAPRRELVDAE